MEVSKNDRIKYARAFTEVELLINDLAEELYIRIPKNFIKLIQENKDKTYKITLEELNRKGEMEETKAIMSLVFRDYLVPDAVAEQLKDRDKAIIEKENNRFNEIFPSDKKESKESVNTDINKAEENKEISLVEVKEESLFDKIINIVKNFLGKLKNKK